MNALVFDVRLNSLYSIILPFTWQSALTYPVLPPSAVIGMLANALQRNKNNKHPLKYLDLIEDNLIWAGSKLLTPCAVKSYITSAIVKWKTSLGGKVTNVLGRQYAYSKKMQVAAIFKDDTLITDIANALKTTPLTCGDSESPISLDSEITIKDVAEGIKKGEAIQTEYLIPFTKETKIEGGNGQLYLMHGRCRKNYDNFPLEGYIVPVREEDKILVPSSLTIRVSCEKIFEIEDIDFIVTYDNPKPPEYSKSAKKRRKKNK